MTNSPNHPAIALEIKDLSVFRGERQIVADLSLSAKSGSFLTLTGENGAGKSTLLAALAGILPFQGRCIWSSAEVDFSETSASEHMLFVSHLNAIKPELTLEENLSFWAKITNGDPSKIMDALIAARLDHLSGVRAGNMSKGQQRRLSICRLMVSRKPIWLLDEPTSALDAQGDAWVAGMIAEHLAQNGVCIAATHRTITLPSEAVHENLHLHAQNLSGETGGFE